MSKLLRNFFQIIYAALFYAVLFACQKLEIKDWDNKAWFRQREKLLQSKSPCFIAQLFSGYKKILKTVKKPQHPA